MKYHQRALPREIRFAQMYYESIWFFKRCLHRVFENQETKVDRLLNFLHRTPRNHPEYSKVLREIQKISKDCPHSLKQKIENALINPHLIQNEHISQKDSSSANYNFFKKQSDGRERLRGPRV